MIRHIASHHPLARDSDTIPLVEYYTLWDQTTLLVAPLLEKDYYSHDKIHANSECCSLAW